MNILSRQDGMSMLPKVWTIVLSKRNDEFVGPSSFRILRYRCLFMRTKDPATKLIVYFHLSSEEEEEGFGFNFPPLPSYLYFYGAFNQVSLHQMRSRGRIREMTQIERIKFIKFVQKRLAGKDVRDELPIKPSSEEKQEALKLIQAGKFYRFIPLNYACHNLDPMNSPYERD